MCPQPLDRLPVASTPTERFEEYLQSRGMRNTKPRKILVEHIFSSHDHFDADNLLDRLPRKGSQGYVSRSTVYRLLAEFVEAGLLRTIELEGRTVYEHDYGYPQHDHLHCKTCNKLIEFQSDELIQIREKIAANNQFEVEGHRLIINGECEDCREVKRKRVRRKVDLI
jgi:Fur family ferric uptake transcriptional regulator